jgi:hypothetical protein
MITDSTHWRVLGPEEPAKYLLAEGKAFRLFVYQGSDQSWRVTMQAFGIPIGSNSVLPTVKDPETAKGVAIERARAYLRYALDELDVLEEASVDERN